MKNTPFPGEKLVFYFNTIGILSRAKNEQKIFSKKILDQFGSWLHSESMGNIWNEKYVNIVFW